MLWGVVYNASDRDTVYMARENGCACQSTGRIHKAPGMVGFYSGPYEPPELDDEMVSQRHKS
jgi:hypothetical protein